MAGFQDQWEYQWKAAGTLAVEEEFWTSPLKVSAMKEMRREWLSGCDVARFPRVGVAAADVPGERGRAGMGSAAAGCCAG